MDMRCDTALVAAETIVELERLARDAGGGTVGTVGEIEVAARALINVIPGRTRFSLDVRGPTTTPSAGSSRDDRRVRRGGRRRRAG